MARDLNDPWAEIRALKERVRILETATPLQDASVTRGRLRVASDDGLVVQQTPTGGAGIRVTGLQIVDGTLRITGTLEGAGTWTWTGPWTLAGAGTISGNTTGTGTLTWTGPWNLNGVGTIAGNVTQTGDLNVTGGGSITAGLITIDPSTAGGSIGFGGGRHIDAASGYLGIYDGSRFVVFNSSGVSINGGGGPTLTVGPGGIQGIPTIALGSAPPGSFVGAVIDTGSGARRVVS